MVARQWGKFHFNAVLVGSRPRDVRTRPLSLILADAKSSLLGRFFLFPQKHSFCGSPTKPLRISVSKSAAIGKRFFHSAHPRVGSSVTLAGDHTGAPLRRTHGSFANYKYMSSVTLVHLTRSSACKFRMKPKVPIRSRRQVPLQRPWNLPFHHDSGRTSHNQMLCPLHSGQVLRNTIPLPTGHKR